MPLLASNFLYKETGIYIIAVCFIHPTENLNWVMNLTFMDLCIIVQFVREIQQDATMYQNFIIPYLYEAQHVSATHRPLLGA
jgi:hypothetical protein